jgi:hypothetical protein
MNISTVLGDKFALSFPGTFIIFNCFCLLLGVCGNCGVIHHALMNYDMTPNSVLVSNLAVTDLLVCLTTYPIWMADMIEYIQGIDENVEFCKFSHSSGCVALGLAVFMQGLKFNFFLSIQLGYQDSKFSTGMGPA